MGLNELHEFRFRDVEVEVKGAQHPYDTQRQFWRSQSDEQLKWGCLAVYGDFSFESLAYVNTADTEKLIELRSIVGLIGRQVYRVETQRKLLMLAESADLIRAQAPRQSGSGGSYRQLGQAPLAETECIVLLI